MYLPYTSSVMSGVFRTVTIKLYRKEKQRQITDAKTNVTITIDGK